jgi:hypothetical protein
MAQEGYPENRLQWKAFKWIEDRIALRACAICFTSPSAITDFISKYPDLHNTNKLHLIENGYDEESFSEAENYVKAPPLNNKRPIILLHSGVVYPSERDPRPLFKALSNLKKNGSISSFTLKIVLRATGHDKLLSQLIASSELEDIIELAPPLPYIEALAEMLSVDGLIVLQASNCNFQIPAKLYEYIRTGKPIIGLTDKNGDTASILKRFPTHRVCDISLNEEIEIELVKFINQIRLGTDDSNSTTHRNEYSRKEQTRILAHLFNNIKSEDRIGK